MCTAVWALYFIFASNFLYVLVSGYVMKYVKNKSNEPIPFSETVTETHMFVRPTPGSTKATGM
jgi:hypothetical protein